MSQHLWKTLLLTIIILIPKEAYVSGSFSIQTGHQDFVLEYTSPFRISFVDQKSSNSYYEGKRKNYLRELSSLVPKLEKLFEDAKKRGITLTPVQPFMPRVKLMRPQNLLEISKDAFPLRASWAENNFTVFIALKKLPSDQKSWKSFSEEFNRILKEHMKDNARSFKIMKNEGPYNIKKNATPKVYGFFDHFALYIGGLFEVKDEILDQHQKEIQETFQRVAGYLQQNLDPQKLEEHGVKKIMKFDEDKKINPKDLPYVPQEGAEYPLVDYNDRLFETVVLLKCKEYDRQKNYTYIRKQLKRIFEDSHSQIARREEILLKVMNRSLNLRVRMNAIYQLPWVADERALKVLAHLLNNKEESESVRHAALIILSKSVVENSSKEIWKELHIFTQNKNNNESWRREAEELLSRFSDPNALK